MRSPIAFLRAIWPRPVKQPNDFDPNIFFDLEKGLRFTSPDGDVLETPITWSKKKGSFPIKELEKMATSPSHTATVLAFLFGCSTIRRDDRRDRSPEVVPDAGTMNGFTNRNTTIVAPPRARARLAGFNLGESVQKQSTSMGHVLTMGTVEAFSAANERGMASPIAVERNKDYLIVPATSVEVTAMQQFSFPRRTPAVVELEAGSIAHSRTELLPSADVNFLSRNIAAVDEINDHTEMDGQYPGGGHSVIIPTAAVRLLRVPKWAARVREHMGKITQRESLVEASAGRICEESYTKPLYWNAQNNLSPTPPESNTDHLMAKATATEMSIMHQFYCPRKERKVEKVEAGCAPPPVASAVSEAIVGVGIETHGATGVGDEQDVTEGRPGRCLVDTSPTVKVRAVVRYTTETAAEPMQNDLKSGDHENDDAKNSFQINGRIKFPLLSAVVPPANANGPASTTTGRENSASSFTICGTSPTKNDIDIDYGNVTLEQYTSMVSRLDELDDWYTTHGESGEDDG